MNEIDNVKIMLLRKEHKMTQQELADKLGVRRETIIRLEAGKTQPHKKIVDSLCLLFDIEVDELYKMRQSNRMLRYLSYDSSIMGERRNSNLDDIFDVSSLSKTDRDRYETFLYHTLNSFATICKIKKRQFKNVSSEKDIQTIDSELRNIRSKVNNKEKKTTN